MDAQAVLSITGIPAGRILRGTYVAQDTDFSQYMVVDKVRLGVQQDPTTVLLLKEDVEDASVGNVEVDAYARVVWTQRTWHNGAALTAAEKSPFSQRLYESVV